MPLLLFNAKVKKKLVLIYTINVLQYFKNLNNRTMLKVSCKYKENTKVNENERRLKQEPD